MRPLPNNFTALMAALQFHDARTEALTMLNESEWLNLLSFCDLAHLTLLLPQISTDVLPSWVVARIQSNVSDNATRFERIKAFYAEVARVLEDNQIEHLVIKGFAQFPGYVENPRLHMQGDIDIFCLEESIHGVRAALETIGFCPDQQPLPDTCDHVAMMVPKTDWKWRGNAFDPEMPLGVEPHFCLWNEKSLLLAAEGVDQFWSRRTTRQLEDFSFRALCPEDNLGFSALHILRDLLRSDWIIHRVYETARFLHVRSKDSSFWKSWHELHSDSLRSLEAISFCLARTLFGCDVSEEVEREVLGLPAEVQQWFRLFSQSPLEWMFHPNKDGVWLHLALLKSSSDKRTIFRRVLFPAKLPSLQAPNQNLTKFRQVKKWVPAKAFPRYLAYVTSRAAHHIGVLPPALWHGFSWWLSQRELRKGFWTFFSASLCFALGLSIFFFLFNLYLIDRGFTENFLGWLISSMAAGSIAGTMPAGRLAKKFGLRKALLVCFASVSLIFVVRGLVLSEPLQMALAFLAGAMLSIWAVCISPAVAQLTTERNRPFAFSLVFSSGVGMVALGALAGGALPGLLQRFCGLAKTASSQAALLVSCGIVAMGLLPIYRLTFADLPGSKKQRISANPFLLRFLFSIAIWSLVTGAFNPFANVYFARHLQMSLPRIGAIFSVAQLAQVVAILAAPIAFRKFGLVAGITYMQLSTSVALAFLAVAHHIMPAALLYVGYTALQWMSEPGMYSLLMDRVSPEERSGASAWNVLVISSSQAVAAVLAGAGLSRFGYPAVLSVTAAIALAAACSFRLLLRTSSVPS